MNLPNPYKEEQMNLYQVDSIPKGIKRITKYNTHTFNDRKYYIDLENNNIYRSYDNLLFTCHPLKKKGTVIIDDNNINIHLYNGSKLKQHMETEIETY